MPLAIGRMPQSLEYVVKVFLFFSSLKYDQCFYYIFPPKVAIEDHVNLDVLGHLKKYPGLLRLIRRTNDEIIAIVP